MLCGSAATAAILAAAALLAGPAAARAATTPILAENALAGNSGWLGPDAPPEAIQGFASEPSVAPGDTIHFHVATAAGSRYRVELYRLGWYGGAGARLVACSPSCGGDEAGIPTGGQSGDGVDAPIVATWPGTDTFEVDASWTSGYYLARFLLTTGPHAGESARTFFVVRSPDTYDSQILVQVPVNTWEAYNQWGGKSLYDFYGQRGLRVSFERPYGRLAQSPLWYEVQLVRFLEREGYDVSYQTDVDTDRDPASLLRHRLVIVNGHDEYWTLRMRDAFDTALARGTNLAFLGSNIGYWVVRYEDDRSTIFSYKSLDDPNPDRSQKTAMFREIGRPECALMGVEHQDIPTDYTRPLDFTVTAAAAGDPWFAGTGLHPGSVVHGVVGREYDTIAPWGGCLHPDTTVLFHYEGNPVNPNADAVRFTAASGARVFSAGAQRLSWALDSFRSSLDANQAVPVDPGVQQFMRNALDDLTRPAPPTRLTVVRTHGMLSVSVGDWIDPRVRGFAAAAWTGGRWRLLCQGVTRCSGHLWAGAPARMEFGAVSLDSWGRTSAAVVAFG